jgi:hypothetical protein|tara:strand:- start:1077 stop:1667 length:591 start_codon:yes stop_codon:yes gene_type:complete
MPLTTKLEAVNTMLGNIGESPVTQITVTSTLPISAVTAITVLDEVSREVQSEGWHFNTVLKQTLSPNGSNEIVLATDILHVDTLDNSKDIVQRGSKLFNRADNTFTFTADIDVRSMSLLDFTDLPEQARRYITLKGSRVFQARTVGSQELEQQILRDELKARYNLEEMDGQGSDRTIFDNYDVASCLGVNRNYDLL